MRKRNLFQGTIERYKEQFPTILSKSKDFTIITSGMSRKVILEDGSVLRYFGTNKENSIVDGAFIVTMVQREIDEYIEKNGIPTFKVISDVQNFNMKQIKSVLNKKVPIMGIDINACYWNVAHKLGYISDKLYKRGLESCKKQGLLIAIGCLAKRPLVRVYKNGELVENRFDDVTYYRYCPFYWNILEYTYDIMIKSYQLLKDDWYMFLTDCVFVDVEKIGVAQKFLIDCGFKYKNHLIEYKKFENNKLEWYDYKDKKIKQMYVGSRDINDTQSFEKIKGALRSIPPLTAT